MRAVGRTCVYEAVQDRADRTQKMVAELVHGLECTVSGKIRLRRKIENRWARGIEGRFDQAVLLDASSNLSDVVLDASAKVQETAL